MQDIYKINITDSSGSTEYSIQDSRAREDKLDKIGDASNVTVSFDVANSRESINSGESLSTIIKKVSKYLSDLQNVAFTGNYSNLNNVPVIDSSLSDSSENAVQNKIIFNALNNKLSTDGGDISGDLTISGTLILSSLFDASGTKDPVGVPLIIGLKNGTHLEFDSNEIMAKSNGTTVGDLYLNPDGGVVYINGNLSAQHTSTPVSGQVMVSDGTSGGIKTSGYTIASSVPANAKFTDTTYTIASLMGSSAKGSATQPIYWNGSAFATTTYTLGKSVPSNAVFTDTVYSLPTASSTTKGGIHMLHGNSSVSVSANSYADKEITFSSAFPGTPGVMICRYATNTASTSVSSSCARQIVAHSSSSKGFKVRAYNNTSSAWTSQFRYLAIYRG